MTEPVIRVVLRRPLVLTLVGALIVISLATLWWWRYRWQPILACDAGEPVKFQDNSCKARCKMPSYRWPDPIGVTLSDGTGFRWCCPKGYAGKVEGLRVVCVLDGSPR